MTIWKDPMITMLDGPLTMGDRVVLIRQYTIEGRTDPHYDGIAKPGARGKIFEGPFDDGTIDVEWDAGTGNQKYSKIDAGCLARETP
jgi:hypothetical protein